MTSSSFLRSGESSSVSSRSGTSPTTVMSMSLGSAPPRSVKLPAISISPRRTPARRSARRYLISARSSSRRRSLKPSIWQACAIDTMNGDPLFSLVMFRCFPKNGGSVPSGRNPTTTLFAMAPL